MSMDDDFSNEEENLEDRDINRDDTENGGFYFGIKVALHKKEFEGFSYNKINEDIIKIFLHTGWGYWLALAIAGVLVLIGTATYYYQSVNGLGVWGTNEPIFWGLDIPSFIFWIGFSLSGTLLSAILLLTKSHWRNPIFRAAEIMTGAALMTAGVIVLTHMGKPWRFFYTMPYPNMRFLWPNFHSPLTMDILGMVSYLTASMLFLFVGAIPDFAVLRDHTTGWRKKFYSMASLGWNGSNTQWLHYRRAYLIIACFIIPIAILMHSVTAWVPSLTTNPGAHSTIFPVYFVVGALLSGAAGVILILVLLRRFLHIQEYIKIKYLDHLAKLVLLASMLISYIYLIEIFVPSYKASNFEFMPLAAKLYGKFAVLYWPMIFLNGVAPLAFFFRRFRQNTVILFVIAAGVQIGMYFERILMVIPSLSISQLPSTWASYQPTWVEFVLLVWGVSIFTFLYLAIIKIIPPISIYEVKELTRIPRRSEGHPPGSPLDQAPVLTTTLATTTITTNGQRPLLGVYSYVDDTLAAIDRLRDVGFSEIEVLSPIPCHEINEALGQVVSGRSFSFRKALDNLKNRNVQIVRFSAIGTVVTVVFTIALAGGTAILYPIQGGGLPILSLPAIGFVSALLGPLGGLVITIIGMFFLAKLAFKSKIYDTSVTKDRFAVIVHDCDRQSIDICTQILMETGAEKIVERS